MKNNVLITVIAVLLMGGISFFGGMKYQQSKRLSFNRQFDGGQMMIRNGREGNQTNFRPVSGEIISSDDKSITVKLPDGSSKIVLLTDKTEITKAAQVAKSDIKIGDKVAVFGQENSDGSVTGQTVQLNPFNQMQRPSNTPEQ